MREFGGRLPALSHGLAFQFQEPFLVLRERVNILVQGEWYRIQRLLARTSSRTLRPIDRRLVT